MTCLLSLLPSSSCLSLPFLFLSISEHPRCCTERGRARAPPSLSPPRCRGSNAIKRTLARYCCCNSRRKPPCNSLTLSIFYSLSFTYKHRNFPFLLLNFLVIVICILYTYFLQVFLIIIIFDASCPLKFFCEA